MLYYTLLYYVILYYITLYYIIFIILHRNTLKFSSDSFEPVADLGWSIGEGHFRSEGRGRQNSLPRAWPAENFPECPYITEYSYYIASNNCGAWKIIFQIK